MGGFGGGSSSSSSVGGTPTSSVSSSSRSEGGGGGGGSSGFGISGKSSIPSFLHHVPSPSTHCFSTYTVALRDGPELRYKCLSREQVVVKKKGADKNVEVGFCWYVGAFTGIVREKIVDC
jgi:hypothetical protein